ncbi:MAK10-like protein [Tanacetum coccineum]
MEEEKSVKDNRVVGKNIVKPNKSNVAGTLEEVDREDEVGNRTNNESARNTEKDLTKEKELIEGLVGNSRFNDSLLAMQSCKMECEAYHSLPVEPIRKAMLKKMIPKKEDIGGSDVNVMPLSTYNRLTNKKLVETNIRLSLASQSHIQPLGITEDVLVEIAGFIYPVDFVILDIKENRRKSFILGTPFLTTAKAEIRFDKGTITLKSGKSKTNFGKIPEFLCKFKESEKDESDPVTPTSTINKLILKWEERIKLHQEK